MIHGLIILLKLLISLSLDGDVPRPQSIGVYISQLIRFARVCSNVSGFYNRNNCLSAKLFNKVIDIITL